MPSLAIGTDRRERLLVWLPALLIAAAIVLRLVWLGFVYENSTMLGEAANIAVAFAQTGTIADAYRVGQGPTAHLTPLSAIIAGTVYRTLGVKSAASQIVLSLWSIALVCTAFWCLFKAFAYVGASFHARVAALAFVCLVPLSFALEVLSFRVWEGGLAVALAYSYLYAILRLDRQAEVTMLQVAVTALHAAVCLFVSPALGIAAYVCGLVLLIKKLSWRRMPLALALIATISVLVFAPWIARNYAVFGKPIATRTNAGVMLAQSYYAEITRGGDTKKIYRARHAEVDPMAPEGNAAMLAAGGEVAYGEKLTRESYAWMAANPAATVKLTVRHLVSFVFPARWYWAQYGSEGRATDPKLALTWLVAGLALAGIVHGLHTRTPGFVYVTIMALVPLVPYALVEPTLRYRYVVASLWVFIAVNFVAQMIAGWRARRTSGATDGSPELI